MNFNLETILDPFPPHMTGGETLSISVDPVALCKSSDICFISNLFLLDKPLFDST